MISVKVAEIRRSLRYTCCVTNWSNMIIIVLGYILLDLILFDVYLQPTNGLQGN